MDLSELLDALYYNYVLGAPDAVTARANLDRMLADVADMRDTLDLNGFDQLAEAEARAHPGGAGLEPTSSVTTSSTSSNFLCSSLATLRMSEREAGSRLVRSTQTINTPSDQDICLASSRRSPRQRPQVHGFGQGTLRPHLPRYATAVRHGEGYEPR